MSLNGDTVSDVHHRPSWWTARKHAQHLIIECSNHVFV